VSFRELQIQGVYSVLDNRLQHFYIPAFVDIVLLALRHDLFPS